MNELKYKLGPLPTPPILPYEIKGYVSTVAGNNFSTVYPYNSVKDNDGNIYVLDWVFQVIRKFSTNGEISILAGQYFTTGSTDGVGTNALFNYPSSISMDINQNIIVADTRNHLIRKVTLAGVVTTIAGAGAGYVEGNGTNAKFNTPISITVDSSNNIFVADYLNNAIRMINPAGDVTTFAGGIQGFQDGVGTAARFYKPTDIAFDSLGNLFVADSWNFSIRKITPGAVVSVFAGGDYGSLDGNGASAQFKFPYALAIDSQNNIFVSDPSDNTIRKITPNQDVTTFAGSVQGSANGTGTQANFYEPRGLYIDKNDIIYVADYRNAKLRTITPQAVVSTLFPRPDKNGQGRFASFYLPSGIVQDSSGNFFITDTGNQLIRKMTSSGLVTTFAGSTYGNVDGTGTNAQFQWLEGIAIDGENNLYVTDSAGHNIRKITSQGVVTTLAGGTQGYADGTGSAAQFYSPNGITVDSLNNLYVADSYNNCIRKITPGGVVTTIAGGISGYEDGDGISAKFHSPNGITIDSHNNLFVVDTLNNAIRKISLDGTVTTFAGSTISGFTDGMGTAAQFNTPNTIAIDSNDNLYIGDRLNNAVRKITSSGMVSTVAGSGVSGYIDAFKNNALFKSLAGMVIGKDGVLYLADQDNYVIRKIE